MLLTAIDIRMLREAATPFRYTQERLFIRV